MDVFSERYGTPFIKSDGKMSSQEFDADGKFKIVPEEGILGRFVKMDILNSYKSKAASKPVFDRKIICQIKVDTAQNKDLVSHAVVGKKGEELKARFKTAWAEFEGLEAAAEAEDKVKAGAASEGDGAKNPEGKAATTDGGDKRAALMARAKELGIKSPHFYTAENLSEAIAEAEGKTKAGAASESGAAD
jgi:hypothetical protein